MESEKYKWKNREQQWFLLHHNEKCTICGKPLVTAPMSKSYYGEDEHSNFQHVCGSCRNHLISPLEWTKHRLEFIVPEENATLWKYMDLAKLVSLFSKRTLYLRRLDKLDDKYEGAICSERGKEHTDFNLSFSAHIRVSCDLVKKQTKDIPAEEFNRLKNEKIESMKQEREHMRSTTFISCWSKNSIESEAMWRLYAKDMKCGVAIKTTYKKLFFAINPEADVEIGQVHYNEYGENDFVGLHPVWYKRKSLNYENEVRIVTRAEETRDFDWGVSIPVDVNALIQEIVVSPEADIWFIEVVTELCSKYNISSPVRTSEIQISPYY